MFKKTWIRNLLVIAVLLGIFLGLAVNTVQPRGNLSFLEKGLRIAASPFQYGFRAVDGAVSGFFTYFTDKEKLQQENEELKQQLSQLNSELTQMSEISMENIRLRELLNYKEETREFYRQEEEVRKYLPAYTDYDARTLEFWCA